MTERLQVLPTAPGLGRGLVYHDERSKAFRAVDLLPADAGPRDRRWRRGGAYDQGQTSKCVAFTGKGLFNTAPVSGQTPYRRRSAIDPDAWYNGARANDQWPGEAYDGTSALGLAKYLVSIGVLLEYRHCFGADDVIRTVSHIGPVGIGIGWTQDMFHPGADGFIRPTGGLAGGHEIEVSGNSMSRGAVELTNSWGPGWGEKGRAWLSWIDLASLLADSGDAIVFTKVALA